MGIRNKNQQVNFKNISFQFCRTALAFGGGFTAVVQGARFDTCGLGVDATGGGQLGSVIVLDSTSVNSGPVVKFRDTSRDSGPRNNQIVLENLSHSGNNPVAIAADGSVRLQRISPSDTWLWGNVDPGTFQTGQTLRSVINGTFEIGRLPANRTSRSGSLLSNGKFFTKPQPTYRDFTKAQIVNVKAVSGHT